MVADNPHIPALRIQIKSLSKGPGVYLMKDNSGAVIYVGKALSLRDRVRSYFGSGDGRSQIEFLMRRVAELETIVTHTEEQALILESDLIKKFKPRYNIRLKDDKAYLSVRIDRENPWPRLELIRKVSEDGATYYGPFSSSTEIRELLNLIRSVIPLRTCTDVVMHNRQRPCLEYEIKRCLAPCCLAVDRVYYFRRLKQAERILQGRIDGVRSELQVEMEKCSESLNFEEAAVLRDKISFLEHYASADRVTSHKGEDRDVFAIYREGSLGVLVVLMVRGGRLSNSKSYPFEDISGFTEDLLESAIFQFYDSGNDVPGEILLPLDLDAAKPIAKYLSQKSGSAVEVFQPRKGVKYRLITLAELNAKQSFVERFKAEERAAELSAELMKRFNLKQAPRRIECVDISNLQGSNIVASLVSFFEGEPDKDRYRHYNLSVQGKPDDFKSINEVVERRLRGGMTRDDLPDLLVIDGGAGQLAAALAARDGLGIDLEIVALAKGRAERFGKGARKEKLERVFLPGRDEPIELPKDDGLTHLLARIRDEAHRFAITFHRKKRSQRIFTSELDRISGVGGEKRQRLLKHFGTVSAIAKAEVDEIAKIGRMPISLAKKIQSYLRQMKE